MTPKAPVRPTKLTVSRACRCFASGLPVALLAVLAGQACTDRPRSNPLDPRNPVTHGRPPAPRVVTGSGVAVLAWEPLDLGSLDGYRVERSDDGGPFAPLGAGNLPVSQLTLRDSPLESGGRYFYRLVVLADDREIPSDSVRVREGPGSTWYLGESRLLCVSSRLGTGIDTVATLSWAASIDASADGTAWVGDFGAGLLLYVDSDPSVAATVAYQGYPVGITTVETSSSCWVADSWSVELVQVAPGGVLIRRSLPNYPYSLSWSSHDGSVWVGHVDGVSRYGSAGTYQTTYSAFETPYRVSVSPIDGACWVLDGTERTVVRLSADSGPPIAAGSFEDPCDLNAETPDGCCWIADCGSDQLYLVDVDGTVEGVWSVPGIWSVSACRSVDVAWVVCDDGLVRIGRDGQRECAVPELAWGLPAATVP